MRQETGGCLLGIGIALIFFLLLLWDLAYARIFGFTLMGLTAVAVLLAFVADVRNAPKRKKEALDRGWA